MSANFLDQADPAICTPWANKSNPGAQRPHAALGRYPLPLHIRLGIFGQHRTRDALQSHVNAVGKVLEALGEIGQP